VRYGFDALGMRRVGLTHSGGNEASRRIAEKLGFSFEGIQKGSGVALGTGLPLLSSRRLKVFLYDIKANDPWTAMIVAAVVFGGGICAALTPARRAVSVNPVKMIRAE
jgi:ABC-type lipoprotein release transport system permease subunit